MRLLRKSSNLLLRKSIPTTETLYRLAELIRMSLSCHDRTETSGYRSFTAAYCLDNQNPEHQNKLIELCVNSIRIT